ncbi:hypothetical protein MKX01_021462 [Papaver californicum]|nr:hypothetical protein MKX01_021462 [Papaver californicum]
MASTSIQGIELCKNDASGWEVEMSDDYELIKDEILDTLNPCSNGNNDDDMVELPVEAIESNVEPYIGMEFETSEDAREFYDKYSIRMYNSVTGREFVCSREGFRAKKHLNRENRVLPPSSITREGCSAMLRVAVKNGRKWVVSGFVKDHNHDLNPTKVTPGGSIEVYSVRELSTELQREKRRCASCQEQLRLILKDIEEHTQHLSSAVESIVTNVRKLESDELDCS